MLKISKVISVFTFVIVTSFLAPIAFAEPVEMLVSKKWGAYRYDNDQGDVSVEVQSGECSCSGGCTLCGGVLVAGWGGGS